MRTARKLSIIFEDDDILVIDKPPGVLTSSGARDRRPTLLGMVRQYVKKRQPRARVGLIHRLDRDASGLLIFSKNNAAYRSLKGQFFHHRVERLYVAIVRGIPTPRSGRMESRLIELADGRMVRTKVPGKGERAVTEYETITSQGGRSWLRVRLHTGRKHQIRAQLAQRGTPIVNDRMYDPEQPATGRLMLAATELAISHPRSGRRMTFRIDAPREMAGPV